MIQVTLQNNDGIMVYEFDDQSKANSWLASKSSEPWMQDTIVSFQTIMPPLEPIVSLKQQIHEAYDSYISNYVSGVGIGLLTIGVIKGGTKSLSFAGWLTNISADYKTRSDSVIADGQSIDTNFSSHGAPPFTIWEVKTEIGM